MIHIPLHPISSTELCTIEEFARQARALDFPSFHATEFHVGVAPAGDMLYLEALLETRFGVALTTGVHSVRLPANAWADALKVAPGTNRTTASDLREYGPDFCAGDFGPSETLICLIDQQRLSWEMIGLLVKLNAFDPRLVNSGVSTLRKARSEMVSVDREGHRSVIRPDPVEESGEECLPFGFSVT